MAKSQNVSNPAETPERFLNQIEVAARGNGLTCQRGDTNISIRYSEWVGIALNISIRQGRQLEFHFWVRTGSWAYIDERTDLHDCLSVLLAIWCERLFGFSSALYDVGHPAVPQLDRCEVYARAVVPEQVPLPFQSLSDPRPYINLLESVADFERVFWSIFGGCPCADCKKALKVRYDYRDRLGKRLQGKIDRLFPKVRHGNRKDRRIPHWQYFRNFDRKISVIFSEEVASLCRGLWAPDGGHIGIAGVKGTLIQTRGCYHFVSDGDVSKCRRIFAILEGSRAPSLTYIATENRTIAVGRKHVLFLNSDSGQQGFKLERERLKERHDREYRMLFQPTSIQWQRPIDDEEFENLIAELLRREHGVERVRKISHTNEPDGGKDLIVDLRVRLDNSARVLNESDPYKVVRVIVQCKANHQPVNKRDVADIRDTIEGYGYDGFFLAVASHTTRSLTEHLDVLRTKNQHWIDWWTRHEIEERLRGHEDLLRRFPKVFCPV